MKKKFNYHNEDECIKYEKFFMIFYEVFKQYHYKESCNVIAYMGDRTNEEREEMLLKKQKSDTESDKDLIKTKIPKEIIVTILNNLIFFNLIKDFFKWQKTLLEKGEQPNNYDLYKQLEHTLEDPKYSKQYSNHIKSHYHRICCLTLSYDSNNYEQAIFTEHFGDYSDKIFDYCSEIYKEEKVEGRQLNHHKKIYDEYKNILFPPQI